MKTKQSGPSRVLRFKRCGIPFAVDVAEVREIRKFETLRPLALAIHPLIGLATFGEKIIPVFDPHALGAPTRRSCARTLTTVVCGDEGAEIALVADEVQNQTEVRPDQFRARPEDGPAWLQGEVELSPGQKLILLAVNHLANLIAAAEPQTQAA